MLHIIIPTKSNIEVLFKCLTSLKQFTKIPYTLWIADTGSSIEEKAKIMNWLKISFNKDQFHFLEFDYYNYAKINNAVVKQNIQDGILLFCNNDIEFVNPVIDDLFYTYKFMKKNNVKVGTIGCRLVYPDGTIQHDGQIVAHLTPVDYAVSHINLHKSVDSYVSKDIRYVLGNTFALCLTGYDTFIEMGMLNENYHHCFEDLEYNIKCTARQYSNFILPTKYYAIHHESYTRKQDHQMFDPKDYYLLKDFLNAEISKGN